MKTLAAIKRLEHQTHKHTKEQTHLTNKLILTESTNTALLWVKGSGFGPPPSARTRSRGQDAFSRSRSRPLSDLSLLVAAQGWGVCGSGLQEFRV